MRDISTNHDAIISNVWRPAGCLYRESGGTTGFLVALKGGAVAYRAAHTRSHLAKVCEWRTFMKRKERGLKEEKKGMTDNPRKTHTHSSTHTHLSHQHNTHKQTNRRTSSPPPNSRRGWPLISMRPLRRLRDYQTWRPPHHKDKKRPELRRARAHKPSGPSSHLPSLSLRL